MGEMSVPPDAFGGVRRLVTRYIDREAAYGIAIEIRHMSGWRLQLAQAHPKLGYEIRPETTFRWFCAVKAVLAFTALTLLRRNGVDPAVRVSAMLPGYRGGGREQIEVSHLLRHSSGLPSFPVRNGFGSLTAAALATPLVPGQLPGKATAYNICTAWMLIAALIEKLSGLAVNEAVDDVVLRPLGLADSVLSARPTRDDRLVSHVAPLVAREQNACSYAQLTSPAVLRRLPAWLGGLGTLSDLVRFFGYLLAVRCGGGTADEHRVVAQLTAGGQRAYDKTLGRQVSYALGIMTDISTAGFGRGWSEESFGVGGSVAKHLVVAAWADPARQLACGLTLTAVGRLNNLQLDRIGRQIRTDLDAAAGADYLVAR